MTASMPKTPDERAREISSAWIDAIDDDPNEDLAVLERRIVAALAEEREAAIERCIEWVRALRQQGMSSGWNHAIGACENALRELKTEKE